MPGLPGFQSISDIRSTIIGNGRGVRTGNASGDDNDVGASQGVLQAIILGEVARDFLADSQRW